MPAKHEPLTEDQRNLAAENIKLAYLVVNRVMRRWPWVDRDEVESMACMTLTLAVRTYKPSKGKLSTYVIPAMHRRLARLVRRSSQHKTRPLTGRESCPARQTTEVETISLLELVSEADASALMEHFGADFYSGRQIPIGPLHRLRLAATAAEASR